jgi:anti-sigma factor RsiW
MSRCRDILDGLSAIVDGQAGLLERLRFHAHVAMCENCRRYYRQFKAVQEAAGVVLPEDLPGDFETVMDFVLGEGGERD